MIDLEQQIISAITNWHKARFGYPVPIAGGTISGVYKIMTGLKASPEVLVRHMESFMLQRLPKAPNPWQGYVYIALRDSWEQWALGQQALEDMKANAQQAAAQALAEAQAKACPRCQGFGMVGAKPNSVADVREAIKHGAVLCDCEGGEFWREAIR